MNEEIELIMEEIQDKMGSTLSHLESELSKLRAGKATPALLDGITVGPVPGVSSVTAATDELPDVLDSYWDITGTGGSVSTMIIELASFAAVNTFGIYDPTNPLNTVQLFGGANGAVKRYLDL